MAKCLPLMSLLTRVDTLSTVHNSRVVRQDAGLSCWPRWEASSMCIHHKHKFYELRSSGYLRILLGWLTLSLQHPSVLLCYTAVAA